MNMLIKTVVLNNSRVRKLNAFRKLRRSNPREANSVSEDEEESPVPMLGTFMNIQSALTRSRPALSGSGNEPRTPGQGPGTANSPEVCTSGTCVTDPPPGPEGWRDLITQGAEPTATTDPFPKNPNIDYQNLGPIYGPEEVAKNSHQLDMTDILNAILQMVYNKLYIPLSMLTMSSLSKICMNDGLKFRKIPFGNGIGKQSLDESSFPGEDT